jgi:hypothetical protein
LENAHFLLISSAEYFSADFKMAPKLKGEDDPADTSLNVHLRKIFGLAKRTHLSSWSITWNIFYFGHELIGMSKSMRLYFFCEYAQVILRTRWFCVSFRLFGKVQICSKIYVMKKIGVKIFPFWRHRSIPLFTTVFI